MVTYIICVTINSIAHIITGFTTLTDYVSPTVFIEALCLLYLFANMSSYRWVKIMALGSSTSFGVYLIHTHLLFFTLKWKGSFTFIALYPAWFIPIALFVTALIIYVLLSVIDYIRLKLFQLFGILFEKRSHFTH